MNKLKLALLILSLPFQAAWAIVKWLAGVLVLLTLLGMIVAVYAAWNETPPGSLKP